MNMPEVIHQYRVNRTPLSAPRLLTIDPLYLDLEGPLANARFTKDDIEGFRFGISVSRYSFITIGKTYNLEIKSSSDKILLIRMHSFFGIGNRKIRSKFISIYKTIHRTYFIDLAIHYVRLLNGGLTYELSGVMISCEGILLRPKKQLIPWSRIGLKYYYLSCSVYDLADPHHFRSFDYWQDWNASLLFSVVEYKLKYNMQQDVLF